MPLDRTHQTYIDVSEEKYLCNDDLSDVEVGEQNYYHYWPTLPPTKKPNLPYIPEMSVSQQGRPQVNDINDTTTYAAHTDRRTRLITQQFNVSIYLYFTINRMNANCYISKIFLSRII